MVEIKAKEDLDVVEMKDGGPRGSESPGPLSALSGPRSPEPDVLCPICQRCFPVAKVELHAAFCDGEAARDRRKPGANHVQSERNLIGHRGPRQLRLTAGSLRAAGLATLARNGASSNLGILAMSSAPVGPWSPITR